MKLTCAGFSLIGGMLVYGICSTSVNAQVIPDATLKTSVSQNGNNFIITNGDRVGNNLFHSFSQFSIPSQGSAFFDNASDIQNIFSRVTGGTVSNIDGLIQANGSANLFLLNPNGIMFGPNASLNIGGSFVGTTANSIKFADGTEFSAVNASETPLLTIATPIGLQWGQNPASIQVNGTGHTITRTSFIAPLVHNGTNSGLKVKPGNTLALIGGNITLNGGILTAEGGKIELGGVSGESASVGMSAGETINYDNVEQFADIQLTQRALVDAGNSAPGSIRIRANNLFLQGASALLLENRSTQPTGSINIQTAKSVQMVGDLPSNTLFSSGILSNTFNTGRGGDVSISTERLLLQGSSNLISSLTFGKADGGNININADDTSIIGGLKDSSVLNIRTLGSGNGGNLTINTQRLVLQDGGSVVNNVNGGSGSAGKLIVNATKSVRIGGAGGISNSLLGSSAVSGLGNAGRIAVNTSRLVVSDGAVISSSTYGAGNGGSITVKASESIEVSGSGFNAATGLMQPSAIQSSGILTLPATRKFLQLPDTVTGSAGNVILDTPRLQLTNGAMVTVRHNNLGDAGMLSINADEILLDRSGKITASTQSGAGGNIKIQVQESLIMRQGSYIDTEAFLTGNGGNITINSPIIVGLENSDIIAKAVQGNGGNIEITTQGIFGLKYSDRQTPENDITASSQFGVNGTVDINNFGVDPSSGLVELPVNLVDSSQQIATGCSNSTDSSFVATGRGGIPQNPSQEVRSDRPWSDIRDLSAYRKTHSIQAQIPKSSETLVQATGWYRNASGKIELVADKSSTQIQQPLTCAAVVNKI